MRGEQRHRGGGIVVHECSKDRGGWLTSPWVDGRQWSWMGGCEPLPVKQKEYVYYIVLLDLDKLVESSILVFIQLYSSCVLVGTFPPKRSCAPKLFLFCFVVSSQPVNPWI
jgi:hypothetical protein